MHQLCKLLYLIKWYFLMPSKKLFAARAVSLHAKLILEQEER